MNTSNLAIFGGTPVRKRIFKVEPLISNREEELVLNAIRNKNFSRYIGSKPSNYEDVLCLPNKHLLEINDEWHFLGGPNIRKFAYDFAQFFDVKYAIPINSATSGISTAIASLNLKDGDEIIIPGLSYTASGTAPLLFNVVPKFVDVDPDTFCINSEEIIKALSPKTKAIMCVHLLGNVCDMDKIQAIAKDHNLKIIEDAAQAPGSKYKGKFAGTIGDVGIFSFQQSKNIMTGEGGMIVTNNPEVAKKCRLILNHGEVCMDETSTYNDLINMVGCNFRLNELSAALGIAQLEKLNKVNEWRNKNAKYLIDKLSDMEFLTPPFFAKDVEPVFHILNFKYKESMIGIPRDAFVACLRAEGIPVGTGYVRGMYANPLFQKKIAYGLNKFPWNTSTLENDDCYDSKQFENIEKLINKEFLWFYHIAYSSTLQDMDDIVSAINKIWDFRDDIKLNLDFIINKGDISKKQGRL